MAAKSLTKAELLDELGTTLGTSKREANSFIDALLAIAYRETKKKGEFVFPGIGKLVKQKRKARKGVNPKTGEPIKIAAATVIKLRLAKAAKDAILGGGKEPATKKPAAAAPKGRKAAKPAAAKAPAKKAAAAPRKAAAPKKAPAAKKAAKAPVAKAAVASKKATGRANRK